MTDRERLPLSEMEVRLAGLLADLDISTPTSKNGPE